MASKQTRAKEFSAKTRAAIKARDGCCIFCKMNYHTEKVTSLDRQMTSIMHYIPRSKGGLGIEQNGALGCMRHHTMLDNGYEGRREEMLELFAEYLRLQYTDWNEDELVYKKWRQICL